MCMHLNWLVMHVFFLLYATGSRQVNYYVNMLNINVYRTLKSRSRILLPSAFVTACLAFNAYIVLNSAILDKQHVLPRSTSRLGMKQPCSVITHLLSVRSTCTRDKMLGRGGSGCRLPQCLCGLAGTVVGCYLLFCVCLGVLCVLFYVSEEIRPMKLSF